MNSFGLVFINDDSFGLILNIFILPGENYSTMNAYKHYQFIFFFNYKEQMLSKIFSIIFEIILPGNLNTYGP